MDISGHTKKIAVIINAAGTGTRFGSNLPKQYHLLEEKPVLRHSIETFLEMGVRDIVTVIHPDHYEYYCQATEGLLIHAPVLGGEMRSQSTLAGLKILAPILPDYVLVHDAARPFIDRHLIQRVISGLETSSGCIPAIAVTDTIKLVKDNKIQQTIPRETLWRAQTPQGFHYPVLLECFNKTSDDSFTDEASLLEKFDISVSIVMGSENNIKITFPQDLKVG